MFKLTKDDIEKTLSRNKMKGIQKESELSDERLEEIQNLK